MKKNYLFTSESVSEGHPDKVCDRISDMVVDVYLGEEPQSRVGCETLTTTNKVVLAGEVRGPEIKKEDLLERNFSVFKKLNPLSGFSIWKEDNPRSNKTPFTFSWPIFRIIVFKLAKLPCDKQTLSL